MPANSPSVTPAQPAGAAGRVRLSSSSGPADLSVRTPGGDWLRLHSARAPEAEAQGLVDRALNGGAVPPMAAVIGVGLGFVIDELRRRRADIRIVALEVIPELLPHWRLRADVDGMVAAGELVVATDPSYQLPAAPWPASVLVDEPLVIVHPALAHHWPSAVERARKVLAQFLYERRANEEARQRLAPMYLEHTLRNLEPLLGATDVSALEGVAAGEPLILCGAGPSLDRLLPELKAQRSRSWLVALDTAVRPLMAAGIVPDLVVCIDPTPLNGRHLLDLPRRQRPWLVAETSVDPRALAAFAGRLFACRINRADPWPWLETLGVAPTKVRAWGSVLTTACDLITHMKPASVAFAAIDLAYTNGQTYCRGTVFEEDWEEHRVHHGLPTIEAVWDQRLRGNTVDEPDVHGRLTATASHLVAFRNWARTLVANTPSCRFVNVTGAGILHGEGITQTTLESWLEGTPALRGEVEPRLARLAVGSWRPRRAAVLTALTRAVSAEAEEPWAAWQERVPRVDRGELTRALEHNRRRTDAFRGVTDMSTAESDWIDVPFDAGHFYAAAPMQWRVCDHGGITYSYRVDGKTLMLSFTINRSSIEGPPTRELFMRLPGEYLAARGTASGVWIANRIFKEMGYARVHPGQNRVVIHRANEEPFPNEDGYFYLFGQLFLEIQ